MKKSTSPKTTRHSQEQPSLLQTVVIKSPAGERTRTGRDINDLVEHPFASLSTKPEARGMEHIWETQHPVSGEKLQATWRVEGSLKRGLPTATDERVYLALMELTREVGFSRTVGFTRYDLLQRLGWPDDKAYYRMLNESFERLASVTIISENVFWNEAAQAFYNVKFNIIDNYEIINEAPGGRGRKGEQGSQPREPRSFFRWNDIIHESMEKGNIRTLDLEFALSLDRPVSLRLYRYLDKKAHDGKAKFEIELHRLCELHLGMTPAPYNSTLKQRLKPAHDELRERGYLAEVSYSPMRSRKGEKVRYTFGQKNALPPKGQNAPLPQLPAPTAETHPDSQNFTLAVESKTTTPQDIGTSERADAIPIDVNERQQLLQRMLSLKVTSDVANSLLKTVPLPIIALQLDCLIDRHPKNPAATLVKAVRANWEAPPKYFERLEAEEREESAKRARQASAAQKAVQDAKKREETAAQEKEAAHLDAMWEKLDIKTRERIESEAQQRLGVLGQTGRAQGALVAMRRNLLREKMGLYASDSQSKSVPSTFESLED